MPTSGRRSTNSAGLEIQSPVWNGSPPPIAAKKMSSWRQRTPFGSPVVPPVYTQYRSSSERASKSRTSDAAANAVS